MTWATDAGTIKPKHLVVQEALNGFLESGSLEVEGNTVYTTTDMQAVRIKAGTHSSSIHISKQLLLIATMDNDGHLETRMNDAPDNHKTTSGLLYFVPAGVRQEYAFNGKTRNIIITLDMSILKKVQQENVEFRDAPVDVPRFPFRNPRLMRKMTTLIDLASKQDIGWRSLTDACNTQIAVEVLKSLCNAVERVARPLGRADLTMVRDYAHAHLEQNIGLEQVADLVGRDVYGFGRAFKSATGLTFHQFITRLRVDEARRLLTTTATPIVEVAYACGFSSQAHLTTVVGRHTGMTPGALRQQSRG